MGFLSSFFEKDRVDTGGLESAAQESEKLQREVYKKAQEDVAPWLQMGQGGASELSRLLGVGGDAGSEGYGSLLGTFGMDEFQEDPGYQFRKDEAQKGLERSMAAQGMTFGGGSGGGINPQVARALEEQRQGLASQEYGAAHDRYRMGRDDIYRMLMGASEGGKFSAPFLQQSGQQHATNIGNIKTGLAQAQLQAKMAEQPSMFGRLMGELSPAYSAATGTGSGWDTYKTIMMGGM